MYIDRNHPEPISYECSCFTYQDPIDTLCSHCRKIRLDWESGQKALDELAKLDEELGLLEDEFKYYEYLRFDIWTKELHNDSYYESVMEYVRKKLEPYRRKPNAKNVGTTDSAGTGKENTTSTDW